MINKKHVKRAAHSDDTGWFWSYIYDLYIKLILVCKLIAVVGMVS